MSTDGNTPNYIKALLMPNAPKAVDRKSWSISVQNVLVPFFTATNATGDTQLSSETLGAPIRLSHDKDGSIKMSKSGRPVTRLCKELSDNVRLMRDNFIAGLVGHTTMVQNEHAEAYNHQVDMAKIAGEAIITRENGEIADAQARAVELATEHLRQTNKGRGKARAEDREAVGASV